MNKENNRTIEILKQFFQILDTVEESDEGRLFHPTQIHSCRALDARKLENILMEFKNIIAEHDKASQTDTSEVS